MRNLSQSLSSKLASGVTNLCWCWKFVRDDGVVFAFTDHDMDLFFDDINWKASTGVAPGMVQSNIGFESGSAGLAGSILHDDLQKLDLMTGKFDGARVEIWRVDWQQPNDRIGIWAGEIGEVQLSESIFTAELLSNSRKLERTIGRTFSKSCDAELGDARCAKDISGQPFQQLAIITEVLAINSFVVAAIDLPKKDWFVFGVANWIDAEKQINRASIETHYSSSQGEAFQLLLPPKLPMAAGDQIILSAGCNKSLDHCTAKFSNVDNFRGCPFMPGNDEVLAAPFAGN